MNTETVYDLLIIGGGINGVGIARDAAGRSLSVLLCEKNDLASGTSGYSTKLIHGGLRYLENFEFGLVREALQEREILLKIAPHIIEPLDFILPYEKHLRPRWMIKLGLFLYDHLSKKKSISTSKSIAFKQHPAGSILDSHLEYGFQYGDCRVDDSRLVILNALSAAELGATILTQTEFINTEKKQDYWLSQLKSKEQNTSLQIKSRAIINATGPWIQETIDKKVKIPSSQKVKLIKGSHIILKKIYDGDFAFVFQNEDKRIVFAIPYENDFTLIGTTEVEVTSTSEGINISQEEINYLCKIINRNLKTKIHKEQIINTYSGVRPLHFNKDTHISSISRDYFIELLSDEKKLALLNIFGGKITTYRRLAEQVLQKLQSFFPDMKPAWTDKTVLPGGNFPNNNKDNYLLSIKKQYSYLPPALLERYIKEYGTITEEILADVKNINDLGENFCGSLYECEIMYLKEKEWAKTAEDILWRRTKQGLYSNAESKIKLAQYLKKV